MSKRFLITLLTLLAITGAAALAIFLAKGYIFSPSERRVIGTGIIAVTSLPDGASVYIDGHLTSATNTTISQLPPKGYTVKIVKEGFIPWEKQVSVSAGLVTEIKATLFPALPTFYPLTFNGAVNPVLSPDGQKLAFAVPATIDTHGRQRGGIWIWTMTSTPISFTRGAEPHQIIASTPSLDFSKATLRFSPDSSKLLVTMEEGGVSGGVAERNFLLPTDRLTSTNDLRDITPVMAGTIKEWEDDQKIKDEGRILAIKDLEVRKVASSAAVLQWSPDETKFMIGGDNKNSFKGFKVYDLITPVRVEPTGKVSLPSPNILGQVKVYDLPEAFGYFWLPDSRHIILVYEDKIAIAEFDGSNVAVIFAGSFQKEAVFSWFDSSRLVILTSFPTPTGLKPNLFGINLK